MISNSHFSSHWEAALQHHLLPINQQQPHIHALTPFPKFYLLHTSKDGSFFSNCYYNVRIIHELLYQGSDVFIPLSSHSNDLMWYIPLCLSSGFLVTIQYSKHLRRKEGFFLSSHRIPASTWQTRKIHHLWILFFQSQSHYHSTLLSFTPQKNSLACVLLSCSSNDFWSKINNRTACSDSIYLCTELYSRILSREDGNLRKRFKSAI